ncbi:MAG: hypothetical protein KGJ80_20780 [Chloroflexota bacterium]|nr:hypothetical protein [Chloroflexota bacterium]
MTQRLRAAQAIFAIVLALLVILPLGDRFRAADWSAFDRVYKQWDEIFTLPIPRGTVLVGDWGQLNAMRYMQRIENRRPDLQFVGTLYDPAPQTQAAQNAVADGRAIFLAPGVALPVGTYRYAVLGPLLQVRDQPQMQPPAPARNAVAVNAALTLYDSAITTALEPNAPTQSIAPGRTARVALTWRVNDTLTDFLVRLRLDDPAGRTIAQKDEPPVRGLYPASRWQRREYIADVHNFLIPAGTAPGDYQLKMQTLDAVTNSPTSDEIALAPLSIQRATNLTRDQVFIAHLSDIVFDPNIELWGYGGIEGVHRAGETLGISLVWHAREDVGEDLAARFALIDESGKVAAEWQRAPIAFYPTREWRKGETLKAYYDLSLPTDLPRGEFSLAVDLGRNAVTVGKIQIVP